MSSISTLNYTIGSIIEYRSTLGELRMVEVTDRDENVKNGRPGFEGDTRDGEGVWGYDSQITRVVRV